MRRQSGTSALKALLYMDEIFGFFPPSKNPPSKEPMLILLKQARAFGLGVVLSTQNPVDLDYKGLSNIGTWFIGRLQTTQDIEKVVDGLGGKVGSSFNKSEIREILANLQKRTFFLKSAHLEDIRLFSTRWVLSYLKGPLKKSEISTLMQDKKELQAKSNVDTITGVKEEHFEAYQTVDDSIPQYYEMDVSEQNNYSATLGAKVKVHFYQARRAIDEEEELILSLPLESSQKLLEWAHATQESEDFARYMHSAPQNATFSTLPDIILEDRALKKATRELKETLYRTKELVLFRSVSLKLESKVGESHTDFLVRVQDSLTHKKELEIEKLQERYAKKEKTLQTRLQRAKERVEKESSDSTSSMIDTGIAVLGALFGKPTPTKIGRALNKGRKVLKERGDISRAQERMLEVEADMESLEYELEDKIDALHEKYSMDNYEIERFSIRPRKTDIDVEVCAVVWRI